MKEGSEHRLGFSAKNSQRYRNDNDGRGTVRLSVYLAICIYSRQILSTAVKFTYFQMR